MDRHRGRTFITHILSQKEAARRSLVEFKPADPKYADALRTFNGLAPVAKIRPVTFVGQPLWDEHVRATELACMHKLDPGTALAQGQAVVQRALDEEFDKAKFPVVDLRVPAGIGLFGFFVGAVVLFARYKRMRLGRLARSEARAGYLFVFPWVFGFTTLTLGPMLASLFFSFTQYSVLSPARWVGAGNYVDLLGNDSPKVFKAFSNTLYLAGIGVPLSLVTGLAVALLLNSAVRGMRYYRTLFYMPAIVPGVASVMIWLWILNADPDRGIMNFAWSRTISAWFGTQVPGWISVEAWAKPSLIVMGLWGAGSGMILWLAGLKGVSQTLYEAAAIDGATPKQQFWAVTLPQLSPILFFNTVMGFIGALQQFDSVYVMTGGNSSGPADSLLVPVYDLFTKGFRYFAMGYDSALAWVIFLIILIVTGIQLWLAPRWVHYEVDK